MKVITPIEITDAMVASSTIDEPDAGEAWWLASTSYTLGQVVIRPNHKKYENILAGSDSGLPENTPNRWLDLSLSAKSNGITNKWAMFDTLRNTQSIKTSTISLVLNPHIRIDSIGFLSLYADDITVTIRNSGVVVYSYYKNLNIRKVSNWYEWFFAEFKKQANVVLFDIPPYTNAEITITLNCTTQVKVGAIVIGNQTYLGKATYGATSDELNFSRIEREVTGESILLQRRSVPKISVRAISEKSQLNKVRDTRRNLNAINTVWSCLDDQVDNPRFDTLLLLGVYKKFEINIDDPNNDIINFEIEEL